MVSLDGDLVYLDTSTLIYAIEGHTNYQNLASGLLIPLDQGLLRTVTSEITLVETLVAPRRAGDSETEALYRDFLTPSDALQVVPITLAVLERVIDLRAAFNFKIPDAIHIATGLIAGCTVFVTRDTSWARSGINVVAPQSVG